MKKKILAFLTVCTLMSTVAVHAQTTVVVRRPSLLSGLVDTAEALLLLPLAVAEGVVVGTAEATDAILNGTTTVYTTPATVYTSPAPVVVDTVPVVTPAPVVVAPAPVQTTTVTRTTTGTTVTRPTYGVVVPRRHVVVAPAPVVRYRYR